MKGWEDREGEKVGKLEKVKKVLEVIESKMSYLLFLKLISKENYGLLHRLFYHYMSDVLHVSYDNFARLVKFRNPNL